MVAADERSQARNRELALERLCERLAAALRVDPPRPADQAHRRRSVQRRLEAKRRQRARKADRRTSSRGVTDRPCSAAEARQ